MHGTLSYAYNSILIISLPTIRSRHLGISSWAYGRLGEIIDISANRFSGAFALFDVPMSRERYWVTVSLDNISPERDDNEEDIDD